MRLNDLIRVSMRQVIRHRRRYMGVVLAIALGVAGFLNIVTMSREVKKNFNENLDLIGGVTVLRIYFDNQRSYRPQWFREQTLTALKHLDGVKELSLTAVKYNQTNFQGQHFAFSTMAVDEGFWQVRNFWPLTGKLFDLDAVTGHKREVVLGAELAKKIFGDTHIRGRDLEIDQEIYQVSGVLGGVTDSGLANSAFLPITTAGDRFSGRLLADRVYLRCATWDDVEPWRRRSPESYNLTNRPNNFTSKFPGGLKTGADAGLVDRVFDLPGHQRHFPLGGRRHLERDDGRGHLPNPGNRVEKSHGR